MAFKDGMNAISKVLTIVSVFIGGLFFIAGAYQLLFEEKSNAGDGIACLLFGIFLFLLFWVPAYVIRKFAK